MQTKIATIVFSSLLFAAASNAQTILNANGPGNTYELITNVLAPGNDTSAVEDPQCIHPSFGRHVAEVFDAELNQYVFEFYSHVAQDNDRCINFDRQRVEIKTYDASPDNLKGVVGETVTYKWRFKLPVGFQPSSNFTHIHQIKAVGGNDDDPIFTLTPRKGSPNKIELIHNNTTKVVIVNQSLFEGVWVECTEVVYVHPTNGTYSMVIKKVSDGTTLLSYSNANLLTIRADNTFIRPKWGIYRSLLSSSDLRDEAMRFAAFYIAEGASLPNAPTSLTANAASSTQINLSWTDNSTIEESFRIERSVDGTTWLFRANAQANAVSYSDTGLTALTTYHYRVRAENTFGNSSFAGPASATTTQGGSIIATGSGNWNSTTPGAPWPGGGVPTSSDDVVIAVGHTVTLNVANAACNNITVNGTLQYIIDGTQAGIVINGSLSINSPSGICRVSTRSPAGAANSFVAHTVTIYGNLTNTGTFDCRAGSNAAGTANGIELTFFGASNSSISLQSTTYQSTVEEFNSITINKTGSAKVILSNGNLFMSNNSSVGTCVLTLTNGIIETGANTWVALSTSSGGVTGASASSYVVGNFGRGMSTSAGTTRKFEVGDANGYRPINVHSTTAVASGGYVKASVISGDANTGSSILIGVIVNVSAVRYFQVGFQQGTSATTSVGLDIFSPSYGLDDGVNPGNTELRVAYSTDSRATWNGITQTTPHTTDLTAPPTTITPDALSPVQTVNTGTSLLVTLASISSNPLPIQLASFTGTIVNDGVRLNWSTASEVNNYGFYVERRSVGVLAWQSVVNSFVAGHGTTNIPQRYSFTDNAAANGARQYRLKQVDLDGTIHFTEPIQVNMPTSVKEAAPTEFSLKQNYPNPFNPQTEIKFSVARTGKATLDMFDVAGRKMATLFDDVAEVGKYYGIEFIAEKFASGIYFYRLQSGGRLETKRLVVLK